MSDKMPGGTPGVHVTNTVIYEGAPVVLEKDPAELGHLEIIAQAQLLKAQRVSRQQRLVT